MTTNKLTTSPTAAYASEWDLRIEALEAFAQREGHPLVPANHIERGIRLGSWVSYLRTRHKSGLLSASRIAELEAIDGWEWGPLKPGPKSDASRNAEIKKMRDSGMTLASIGEKFGVTRQRIDQILTERFDGE